jgi:hypothetical protein
MLLLPKIDLRNSANAIVGADAPSFSSQVRFGEPGAPVQFPPTLL